MRYGTYTCGLANGLIEYGFTFGEAANEEDANTTGPCEIGDSEFDIVLGAVRPDDAVEIEVQWTKYAWVAAAIMEAAKQLEART